MRMPFWMLVCAVLLLSAADASAKIRHGKVVKIDKETGEVTLRDFRPSKETFYTIRLGLSEDSKTRKISLDRLKVGDTLKIELSEDGSENVVTAETIEK